ncbi:hypothetical protein V5F01_37995 [Streptomyces sp. NRRL B-2790]|uniref:hypothetical protein n=1 Tax=Streptomyces sp. NRRL B-2790 TaxID=1463835 RepID=UPI00356ACDD3
MAGSDGHPERPRPPSHQQNGANHMGTDGDEGRNSTGEGGQSDDAERRATEKFINDLLARGEAVFEGEEPTPSTTHVIKREDDGRLTARRLRFLH